MRDSEPVRSPVRENFAELWAHWKTRFSSAASDPVRPTGQSPRGSLHRSWPLALRILVSDDNPAMLEETRERLELLGVVPVLAVDGEEAVALARNDAFDLIFMDMQMPVLHWLSATKLIRLGESQRSGRRTPVVAYTTCPLDAELLLTCGVDGVLKKPCTAQSLDVCLSRWCAGWGETSKLSPGPPVRQPGP